VLSTLRGNINTYLMYLGINICIDLTDRYY
jgi:hypothetical protein